MKTGFLAALESAFPASNCTRAVSAATVIGLPPGIRAYGNDALVYYIPGEGFSGRKSAVSFSAA